MKNLIVNLKKEVFKGSGVFGITEVVYQDVKGITYGIEEELENKMCFKLWFEDNTQATFTCEGAYITFKEE